MFYFWSLLILLTTETHVVFSQSGAIHYCGKIENNKFNYYFMLKLISTMFFGAMSQIYVLPKDINLLIIQYYSEAL